MKYEDVRAYINAALEYGIAMQARWKSLVGVDELARLGAITFGPGYEEYRRAVDHIVRYAAAASLNLPLAPNPVADLEADRTLTPETAKEMRKYAKAVAGAIVEREAKAAGKRASGLRYVEMPADFHPAFDCGVWESRATYSRGAMTTHAGTLWSCRAESTSDRPGTSGAWRLMVKSQQKTGTR